MDFFNGEQDQNEIISFTKENLYIAESVLEGMGVYSAIQLQEGEIIETCPLIVFTQTEADFLQYTNLYNYHSLKYKDGMPAVLALGFGAFYNHNAPSNAAYNVDAEIKVLTVTAVQTIDAGTEITINYNGTFDAMDAVAFAPKDEIYEFTINLL